MKKRLLFIVSLASAFCFISCEMSQRPAQGLEDEIYVVADSSEFNDLSSVLDSAFEKIIYTPQPEKLFTLVRITPNQIDKYKDKKNILIIAPLDSRSFTSRLIHSTVDVNALNKIKNGNEFIIKKENLWAAKQLVMILTAATKQELESNILENRDNLIYAFQKISDNRLKSSLYNALYENKSLEGKFLREHGWIIYVQNDFNLAVDDPENNFVWLRSSPGNDVEQWLFVHWIDKATPAYLSEDSIRTIRNRMTEKYYCAVNDSANIKIASDYYTSNEINFNGKFAIFTQGLWELNSKGTGGPFLNYTFLDEKTHRFYMLDGSVYALKYYKRNLIQQVDVLLQSFMTEQELSNDKKQELLSASKVVEKK